MRSFVLGLVLLFIGVFAALTINAIVVRGFDILSVFSIIVLAIFSFGIVGALRTPPEE